MEEHLEPHAPVEKNIYALSEMEKEKHNIGQLPESLGHALSLMEGSALLKETLGEHIFKNFLHVKRQQWNEYRTHVTQWELDNYLSII